MKRRRFIQALTVAPAVPALVAQQGGRGGGRGAGGTLSVPKIQAVGADEAAVSVARYFTPAQFGALHKMAEVMVPATGGNIGALDCDAVEFVDFLIANSPADRQTLYRSGLDALNAQAKKKFNRSFGEISSSEADSILKPLLVTVAWAYDAPKDPVNHFVYQAHLDLRTATRNSLEASQASSASGRRVFGNSGFYWNPIDPVA